MHRHGQWMGAGATDGLRAAVVWVAAALAMLVAGCGSDAATTTVGTSVCASELQWTGGDEGSPLMHPGKDCVGCHADQGEGPTFAVAGTVFGDLHQSADCYGVEGAKVVLTGSDGKEITLTTNVAGNFYLDKADAAALKLPYTAKVVVGGKENKMISPQSAGSCNTCHSKAGANGAPGRIGTP